MFASLSYPLKIRFDFAIKLESSATRARLEWILNNITAQLQLPNISLLFFAIFRSLVVESSILPSQGSVTHFLLPTLIASSLNTWLSSSLSFFIMVISSGSRAAFEFSRTTSLSLITISSAWPSTPSGTACPASHSSFHVGMRQSRNFLLITEAFLSAMSVGVDVSSEVAVELNPEIAGLGSGVLSIKREVLQ